MGSDRNYQQVPHRMQYIINPVYVPDPTGHHLVKISHAVDQGDVAWVVRRARLNQTEDRSKDFATPAFCNLATVNYILAGLQNHLHKVFRVGANARPRDPSNHWQTMLDDFNLHPRPEWVIELVTRANEDEDDTEKVKEVKKCLVEVEILQIMSVIVKNYMIPFGICAGSEKQGGQNEMTLAPVQATAAHVSTLTVDGQNRDLVNIWRHLNISSGDVLCYVLKRKEIEYTEGTDNAKSLECYTLNHYYKGVARVQMPVNAKYRYELVPCIEDLKMHKELGVSDLKGRILRATGGDLFGRDMMDKTSTGYWRVAQSMVHCNRMTDVYTNNDASYLGGQLLQVIFAPVYQDHSQESKILWSDDGIAGEHSGNMQNPITRSMYAKQGLRSYESIHEGILHLYLHAIMGGKEKTYGYDSSTQDAIQKFQNQVWQFGMMAVYLVQCKYPDDPSKLDYLKKFARTEDTSEWLTLEQSNEIMHAVISAIWAASQSQLPTSHKVTEKCPDICEMDFLKKEPLSNDSVFETGVREVKALKREDLLEFMTPSVRYNIKSYKMKKLIEILNELTEFSDMDLGHLSANVTDEDGKEILREPEGEWWNDMLKFCGPSDSCENLIWFMEGSDPMIREYLQFTERATKNETGMWQPRHSLVQTLMKARVAYEICCGCVDEEGKTKPLAFYENLFLSNNGDDTSDKARLTIKNLVRKRFQQEGGLDGGDDNESVESRNDRTRGTWAVAPLPGARLPRRSGKRAKKIPAATPAMKAIARMHAAVYSAAVNSAAVNSAAVNSAAVNSAAVHVNPEPTAGDAAARNLPPALQGPPRDRGEAMQVIVESTAHEAGTRNLPHNTENAPGTPKEATKPNKRVKLKGRTQEHAHVSE